MCHFKRRNEMKKLLEYFDEHLITLGLMVGLAGILSSWIAYGIIGKNILAPTIISVVSLVLLIFSWRRFQIFITLQEYKKKKERKRGEK
jgi:hypothetical protein